MDGEPLRGPIRVGLVGLGRMGLHHLERLSLRADLRATVCFDVDADRLSTAAAFGARAVSTCADLLADPDVDLVLIATPADTHAALTQASLAAGKHTVVEMPLALQAEEAESLVKTAQRAKRLLAVVENRRWDGEFRSACHAVRLGRLGRVTSARYIAWSRGLTPAETGGSTAAARDGGGVLWDVGPVLFDQLLELTADRPVEVYARADATSLFATVRFQSGARATIDVDRRSLVPLQTGWVLSGTDAGWKGMRLYRETAEGEVVDTPTDALPTDWDGWYDDLVHRLRSGTGWWTSAERARDVVILLESAQRSADTGLPVQVSIAAHSK